jgi:vancomycin permeability regulator SanA
MVSRSTAHEFDGHEAGSRSERGQVDRRRLRRVLRELWRFARRRWRRLLVGTGAVAVLAVAVIAGSVMLVDNAAHGHIHSAENVPPAPVALVLGAQVTGGVPSPFLEARLALGQRLLETGKVRAILVSGDNSKSWYDEPDVMRQWLIDHGVPARLVVADYAGFDTYDSCARAKRIFGVNHAIVVTQSFHIARAVSLCRHLGIETDGVGDSSMRQYRATWDKDVLREQGACVKAVFDLSIRRSPVFLGPHESGIDNALRAT